MKFLIFLIIWIFTLFVQAKTTIIARYSKVSNIFSTMDQVSNWWPGFTESEYQSYWKVRFGLSDEDQKLFNTYEKLRWRYYNDPDQTEKDPLKNRNGFFAMLGSIESDPLASIFYSSNTFDEAMERVNNLVSKEDFKFLKDFYKHFESNYSKIIKETEVFEVTSKNVNKIISNNEINNFYDKVRAYYNVKDDINYEVLFVWWPPQKKTLATPSGKYLLMYYNPELHKDFTEQDVVFHEVVHTISMRQPLEQKQKFTKLFLDNCSVGAKIKKTVILEEPLAVSIGQILFMEKFFPTKLNYSDSLYNNPWISSFGRIITPLVRSDFEKNKSMDEKTILSFSKLCSELVGSARIVL